MDDEVEAAELGGGPLDERPGPGGGREVAVAPAGGENAEPVRLEPRGDRAAHAAGAAGDECSSGVAHAGNDKLTRA